jgi:hypothetical protein
MAIQSKFQFVFVALGMMSSVCVGLGIQTAQIDDSSVSAVGALGASHAIRILECRLKHIKGYAENARELAFEQDGTKLRTSELGVFATAGLENLDKLKNADHEEIVTIVNLFSFAETGADGMSLLLDKGVEGLEYELICDLKKLWTLCQDEDLHVWFTSVEYDHCVR